MKKKILIAVGDCVHSKQAVKYTARISSAAQDVSYTLFNVQQLVPRIFSEAAEHDPEVAAEVEALIRENRKTAGFIVEELKDVMAREGTAEKCIEMVSEPVQLGMAKDILTRAERGRYDAIVLARRGLTPRRDFFIGSTAGKVIEHATNMPVWVAVGEEVSMEMMLAVDGSENSVRVLEHVIDMVGNHPDLRLTLFHVLPHLRHYYSMNFEKENPRLDRILQRADEGRMKRFHKTAFERLKAAGFKNKQIETKTDRHGYDISTSLIGEARTGRYGTVVVGRRGEREAFFTGRIAMRLMQKISDQALWMVP